MAIQKPRPPKAPQAKRYRTINIPVADEEKAALEAAATAAGMSLAHYLRTSGMGGGADPTKQPAKGKSAPAPVYHVHHVDDLGADTLRRETPALVR